MRVVRPSTSQDVDACIGIIRGLPEYFTRTERAQIERDLADHDAWVITEDTLVIGFIVQDRRSYFTVELVWMAVDRDKCGHGAGTQLLTHVLNVLAAAGVGLVEVKTLDETANYEPYQTTREFWERRGFHHIDTIDPMPGWPAGNPAALYVAALQTTVHAEMLTTPA